MKTNLFVLFYLIYGSFAEDVYTAVYNYNKQLIVDNSRNENVTNECRNQLKQYALGLENFETWALYMFDAKAKAPTGIYSQRYYHLGNFDECLSVNFQNIKGKYCLGSGGDEKGFALLFPIGNNPKLAGVHIGVCIPNQCTAADVSQIYSPQYFIDEFCYTDTKLDLSTEAIFAITILCLLFGIAFLSTSYDTYLHYTSKKSSSNMLTMFSYLSNSQKLFAFHKTSSQLSCLEGFKALTVMWIVLAHVNAFQSASPIFYFGKIIEFVRDFENMFIHTSCLGVDTFLVIAGLLTSYTVFIYQDKGIKFIPIMFYLHRYLRLTPVFAIVILIHSTLLKYLGSGPLWYGVEQHLMNPCRSLWWWALLYIQNYSEERVLCVPQSWYLSIDMQLFLLSPLVLLSLKKWPKKTIFVMVLLIFGGCGSSFAVAFVNNLRGLLIMNGDDYYIQYYYQTYTRFGPYLVGMIVGYYLYRDKTGKSTLKLHWTRVVFLWTICLLVCFTCIHAGYSIIDIELNHDKWSSSFFIAFNRTAWSVGISGIIFACAAGYGGPVNAFLSCTIFQFLSKLSYCIYLVHYALIICVYLSSKTVRTYGPVEMVTTYFSFFTISVFLAIILYLTVEVPFANLEKVIFKKAKKDKAINNCNEDLMITKEEHLNNKF